MAQSTQRADVALFAELSAIDRLAAIHIERLLPAALTSAQFNVLAKVSEQPGQTPSALAEALALTKPTITHALVRLEAAGLIAIAADDGDRRRKRVTATADGEAAYAQGAAALAPMLQALRTSFSSQDFEAALPFLNRLRAWLRTGAV